MADLTPKQARFVQEYLVDLNATAAARRAGYSPKNADKIASQLLGKTRVKAAIDAAMAKRGARADITAEEVISRLAKIARGDIRKILRWGEGVAVKDAGTGQKLIANGVALISSDEIDDDTAAAISEIRQNANGSLSVKMHDPKAALIELGRHFNLFRDRPVKFDMPRIETADDIVRAVGAVAQAMSRGEITPSEAQAISGVLELKRRAIETADHDRRLAALEARQGGPNGQHYHPAH